MRKGCLLFAAIVCSALWTTAALSAPDIQDGLWEITMLTEMPGMPAGMIPPMKHASCLTKKDAVPQKKESGCTMSQNKMSGNTVTWTVVCDKEKTVSEGKVTYAGTKFAGVIHTTTNDGKEKIQMKNKISGKRIGPCK
jgi:hypothetical protein